MFFKLKRIVKNGKVLKNESLKKHTSFKIGGKAKFFVEPADIAELIDLMEYLNAKNINHYVLGNGTNVLVCDAGFNGVIVSTKQLNSVRLNSDYVQAFCGATLNEVCKFYSEHNMAGFEDAFGIPGSVGGAVRMNASAYQFEMGKMVAGVFALVNGKISYFTNEECKFKYRNSAFNNAIIISVDLIKTTTPCNHERMHYILNLRKTFQPLNMPSAGSVFKRNLGEPVSKIIDDLGFKGFNVGGAKVSEKHAGFIVNCNNATAQDVKNLIEIIKKEVYLKHKIVLEEEIKFIEN